MNEQELILTSLLGCPRHEVYLRNNLLSDEQHSRLSDMLQLRSKGMPLQYILGFSEFMGLKFNVGEGVFIPRPETEILVETAIKTVSSVKYPRLRRDRQVSPLMAGQASVNILDLCTGSGCIAISLAKFLPNVQITATDISETALETAKANAELNNVSEKIKFIQSDLFPSHGLRTMDYGLIISNPPYVLSEEIKSLPKEVQYEPRTALDGGPDGLGFYCRIIKDAPQRLKENGYLIMEMGYNQKEAIGDIAGQAGNFKVIEVIKDYNGIDRVIVLKKGER